MIALAAAAVLLTALSACDAGDTAGSPTTSPVGQTGAEPPTGPTGAEPPPGGLTGKEFDPADFAEDSAIVDNRWLPLQPGMRYVFEGRAFDEGERIERRVVIVVTDLTKVIAGVRTLVTYDLDYNDGDLVESDIAFFAQDHAGNVWQLGEYPEEYEGKEIAKAPAWIHGVQGARAGLTMMAEPRLGTPSYAEGWGPAVGWNDRGRIRAMGEETCVPVDCYTDVLVIREFNRDEPGASQLKYYALGVGNVRVGWMGPNEQERERMVLVELRSLTPDELAEVRDAVLEQEARGYEIKKRVYGQTSPMEPLWGERIAAEGIERADPVAFVPRSARLQALLARFRAWSSKVERGHRRCRPAPGGSALGDGAIASGASRSCPSFC